MCVNRSDIAELDKLTPLSHMVELWLNSNPVSRKQLYRPAVLRKIESLTTLDGALLSFVVPYQCSDCVYTCSDCVC